MTGAHYDDGFLIASSGYGDEAFLEYVAKIPGS
jgi:hypothetical protein